MPCVMGILDLAPCSIHLYELTQQQRQGAISRTQVEISLGKTAQMTDIFERNVCVRLGKYSATEVCLQTSDPF